MNGFFGVSIRIDKIGEAQFLQIKGVRWTELMEQKGY